MQHKILYPYLVFHPMLLRNLGLGLRPCSHDCLPRRLLALPWKFQAGFVMAMLGGCYEILH